MLSLRLNTAVFYSDPPNQYSIIKNKQKTITNLKC